MGNDPVVGESVAHDLAGRRHDVADDRTQVVERFDVGHEAVVEDQVVETELLRFERLLQLRDVQFVALVAERTGLLGPRGRGP